MSAPEKGSFSADIGEDVIEEALRSVERRSPPAQDAQHPPEPSDAEASPDSPPANADAPGDDAGVALEFEAPSAADPDTTELLAEEVVRLRAELESTRAQLELSQSKSREMMERVKETHERALRATADLDNVRKRTAREKEDAQKFANERLLKDFLPVLDNLERALEASATNTDVASLRTGVSMTRKQFEDALARHGVKGFSAKGQPFDPRLHEAMQQVETTDVPPGHVAMEMVRGFMLHERLVRPALVVVARAPAPVAAAAEPPVAAAPAAGSAEASVETSAPAAGANSDSTSAETAADTAQDSRSGGSA